MPVHTEVQPPRLRRAERGMSGFADLVMAEVVRIGALLRLALPDPMSQQVYAA